MSGSGRWRLKGEIAKLPLTHTLTHTHKASRDFSAAAGSPILLQDPWVGERVHRCACAAVTSVTPPLPCHPWWDSSAPPLA